MVVVVYFMYFKSEPEEPIDCDGSWSKLTETYSVTTPMANGGVECAFADRRRLIVRKPTRVRLTAWVPGRNPCVPRRAKVQGNRSR
jgi:hypothetical protein